MSEELPLFGEEPNKAERSEGPAPISDWQVSLLRKALDARGLTLMEDRQRAIEAAVGRPVESLRSLDQDEALRVLARFAEQQPTQRTALSTWDERDEDTWIDRL